jgi:hypothetical protein
MLIATLENINAEMLKYASLAEEIGDIEIIHSSKVEKTKVMSDELFFEEENVYMYLTFNSNIKKIKCVFYLTEIDSEFVEALMSKIGLLTTEENVQNYKRDLTMIDKYWNARFITKYNEVLKKLRKSKIKYLFLEKFKPVYNKNRFNEIVV